MRAPSSETEFQVLKVLWALQGATVAQVRERYNALHGTSLAYTTVMTLLGRLVAKGAAKVDREREPFLYTAASRRQAVLRERLRAFVASVFDGDADELALHLVEAEVLTPDAVERMKDAIARRKRKDRGRSA
ncbi:MAG: BlaI/MecI/CopY family transcriptional regulator [Anaeromyxobacter sp.]